MKKRVLIAGLFHETHTFLEGTTGLRDFHITRGDDMLAAKGDSSPLGGVLELAEEYGWEVIPTADYRAQPSATVEDEVFESFWADIEPAISKRDYDAIYLVLHGAMASQSHPSVESRLLWRIAMIVGFHKMPIFGVLDLHGNLDHATATCFVAYRENPHTDAREAAQRAARLLQRSLTTGVLPTMHFRKPGIVWPPTGTGTAADPMKVLEALARELETKHRYIWDVSILAGFAFSDTPDCGVALIITVDPNHDSEAMSCLSQLEQKAYSLKHLGNVTDPPLSEVMPKLGGFPEGLTVLVEPSDNIGGGAPGDGTGLLRALLDYEVPNSAVCIADPEAVTMAEAAGIGAKVTFSIGGKGSRLDAGPVELEVEVIALNDGRFELEDKQSHLASMCGDHFDMGRCAIVRHQGITILLTSIKTPPFDLGQWRSQGIEPSQLSVIAVKAAVAHRRAYDPIAARTFWVDTPGPCSSNLKTFPYKHIRRPIYPLDS
ncbi:MAG: M81 family metallopeptidase [Verrucomicrobiota bacterium]